MFTKCWTEASIPTTYMNPLSLHSLSSTLNPFVYLLVLRQFHCVGLDGLELTVSTGLGVQG